MADTADQTDSDGTKKPRTRLIIDTEEDLLAALKLRVSKESVKLLGEEVSKSAVVNSILREALAVELREIAARPSKGKKKS